MKIQQVIGSLLLATGLVTSVQAAPLLIAVAEQATAGERVAPAVVVNTVIRTANAQELQRLNTCLTEARLPQGAYERLFRVVALPSLRNGEQLYFVRPALNPQCQAYYGVNGFRHWIVAGAGNAYQVRFVGLGTNFRVLDSYANGGYDLVTSTCTAAECFNTNWRFTGARYSAYRCTETRFSGGSGNDVETVVGCRRQ